MSDTTIDLRSAGDTETIRQNALVALLDVDQHQALVFAQWLHHAGLDTAYVARRQAIGAELAARASLSIVHLPFPRLGGIERLLPRADALQGRPIIAFSAAFRPDAPSRGALAWELGVAATIAASVKRDELINIVKAALRRTA